MKTRKVSLNEFKEIVKNIIKEENEKLPKVDSSKKQKVINQLKGVYKYSQKEAEQLVKDYPDMNATAIHKKNKDEKAQIKENLIVKNKKVIDYKQNGDKSFNVKYDDNTSDKIHVSHDDWDNINNDNLKKAKGGN
jgi:hypothetical protein